jgi:hypothetical protein
MLPVHGFQQFSYGAVTGQFHGSCGFVPFYWKGNMFREIFPCPVGVNPVQGIGGEIYFSNNIFLGTHLSVADL